MRLIAKFYVQTFNQSPAAFGDDTGIVHLSAVCRGDENREWAAATPAGHLEIPSDAGGGAALAAHRDSSVQGVSPEVHVLVESRPEGDWELKTCSFTYGGVQVRLERRAPDHRHGVLEMTVNNEGAAAALRKAFAEALIADEPARCQVWTEALA